MLRIKYMCNSELLVSLKISFGWFAW